MTVTRERAGLNAVADRVEKIERVVADDLIREIYRREGWTRHDRAGFPSCTARCASLYQITADPRRNRYVALRARASQEQPA